MSFFRTRFYTRSFHRFIQYPSGKFSIVFELLYVVVHRTVHFVCKSVCKKSLNDLNLFNDVSGCPRRNIRALNTKLIHILKITARNRFSDLHWMNTIEACLFIDFIFAFIGIVGQMTYICNILNV